MKQLIDETDDTEVLGLAAMIVKARDIDAEQNPELGTAGGD